MTEFEKYVRDIINYYHDELPEESAFLIVARIADALDEFHGTMEYPAEEELEFFSGESLTHRD